MSRIIRYDQEECRTPPRQADAEESIFSKPLFQNSAIASTPKRQPSSPHGDPHNLNSPTPTNAKYSGVQRSIRTGRTVREETVKATNEPFQQQIEELTFDLFKA